MGPVFYLVQCDGALRPISAMILGNWPQGGFLGGIRLVAPG